MDDVKSLSHTKASAKQKDSHICRNGNTNERTVLFAFNVPCRCMCESITLNG